jgi:hypothetical protein
MANDAKKQSPLIAAFCALLATLALGAEPTNPARRIQIEFVDSCTAGPRPTDINLMIGNTTHNVEGSGWIWTTVQRIPSDAHASVKWVTKNGWMRSECQTATPESGDPLKFTFRNCNPGETYIINVSPPEVTSGWVMRNLLIGNRPCPESTSLQSLQTLVAIPLAAEELRLQFGSKEPASGTSLLVNSIVRRAKKERNFSLTVNKTVLEISVQRAHGGRARASTSPNAMDLDIKNLAFAGLEEITIKVQ